MADRVERGYGAKREPDTSNAVLRDSRLKTPLYTAEERERRDSTRWTLVQGVLAPVQFLVFLVSVALIMRYFMTGEGGFAAHASIVVKTFVLYAIMITGAIWERVVFGRYLFARAFFWEDVFSVLVLALHTLYLFALFFTAADTATLFLIAIAAYAAYIVNAAQFVWKLRLARLDYQDRQADAAFAADYAAYAAADLSQRGRVAT